MTIDKQQLQKLLWAEAASFRADCADWKRNTEALDEFLGEKTVVEVALELLAENERVKARLCVCRDCDGQGEVYSGHSSYQGHNQPPEPDMDVCGTCGGDGVLGPLEDFEALAAERDQLKAENEALRKYGEEFAVLAERRREEVETLRKERDARHPFKPFHEPAIGFTGCVICGVYTDHGGLPCPKTRATAHAAMGKVEQP